MIKLTSRACFALLLAAHMLNLQCAESTVFDYKEFYHGSIKPYLACDSTDLAAINNSRTALLQALKKLDQSSKKKVISFMFTHPLFATRSKEDIVHVKKRDLLYYLSSNEIINSEEYLDYAAMLCYFPLLLYAHKIGHETRQLLADWGVNPLWGYDVKATKINKMHQHMSKSPIMAYYEPKIRTYLLKSLCAKDDMYYNTLFDELSPELIEKSAHHAHECALQRINFYKEQIKLNAIFNKKSVPSLAALIGIQLLNKVFFCDEKKQQKKDPQELVRFLKQQDTGHQNLFTALLFFSPESPLNQQFSISKKIDVLNVVSPILPTHRYVYYRTILEYFSSILNVSNLSFSVVHKVLDLGGDPRAVLNNCNAKKKAAIKTLEGCDHRWASLAIFNIISLEKKCFKACEEKLAHYLMHLQKELLVDFMAYFLHAMKEKNYYALKFLLRVVRPGLQNVQAIKEHGRGDKNIRKIINNYRFD